MAEKRVQFNNVVQNQLPSYVREEFPLISEFLKQYYLAQEFQGAPVDLIQNIDRYIKLDETTNLTDSVTLLSDIDFIDTTVKVDLGTNPTGTKGFPDSYGLIQINDEIITYTSKTNSQFDGCIRGFVGITSYRADVNPENLVFGTSTANEHKSGSTIKNLSNLFLKEFLAKTKRQFLPLLDERPLASELNQNLFIKQSKDFYLSRGTDRSFEILFQALYNERVTVVKPREFLFTPSNSDYRVTNDLVVEAVTGDPLDLDQATLNQEPYLPGNIARAYAPITDVEKLQVGTAKSFYKLSLDGGYDRDVEVEGAIRGSFSVHPKTKLIGQVSSGATILNVDSTVGFGTTGELAVVYNDTTTGFVSYTSKTLTEFFGCSNVTGTISDGEDVGINTFAYGRSFKDQDEIITVRINSVLSNLEFPSNTTNFRDGDTARIRTLGRDKTETIYRNWFYNYASSHSVKSIKLVDASDNSYDLQLNQRQFFRPNDNIDIIDDTGSARTGVVYSVLSDTAIAIKGSGSLNPNRTYTVNRKILKGNAQNFPSAELYQANIQGVYDNEENFLVASSSIPSYFTSAINTSDRTVTFSGTFLGDELEVTPLGKHNFYSGDAVYYAAELTTEAYVDDSGNAQTRIVRGTSLGANFPDGLYYVKRISDTKLKLAKSRSDVYNEKFVSVESSTTVTNNTLQPFTFRDKTLESQKLIREIPKNAQHTGKLTPTEPGFTGILVNGVEILNYKSPDVVYYGQIDEVEVLAQGSDYDIIDPPLLFVSDTVGTGATGDVAVSGSLESIRVLDPGFDYISKPTITIMGGNGSGASAIPNMKLIDHSVSFFSEAASNRVALGSTQSTIGFSTYHKLRNGEQIIYRTNGQQAIGGLTTDAKYHVSVQDNQTVKLHNNLSDVLAGINTVEFTSFGNGSHQLQTVNKKSVVESISVINSGSGYENKKRSSGISGISTSQDTINIKNHDFKSGEKVKYTAGTSAIGGLTDGTEYYVIRVDNDNFRLTEVGLTTSTRTLFYDTNQFIQLTSTGAGTHSFNYPAISVSISGPIGISSIGSTTFQAEIQPIFRGEITSVNLSNNGVGYGSSEVLNLDRPPQVTVVSGQDAQLSPVINDGRLQEVLVLNAGKKYNSPPDLTITGDGIGAVITPVMSNGTITSVKVLEPGTGYDQTTTSIDVVFPGRGVTLRAKLQNWRVNLFQKNLFNFQDDDGIVVTGTNEDFGLQYAHVYAPRKFRQLNYSTDADGNVQYGDADLKIDANTKEESLSTQHSPIIGWAYDGHPIYGPYGYTTRSGGAVALMETGYVEDATKAQRPPLTTWPSGFFIEDFVYKNKTGVGVLDENNGRHCVTPDFPNGTYAYFATIATNEADTQSPFTGFRRPKFPYLIGHNYHAKPNTFNFQKVANQDEFDFNNSNYIKNTAPFNYIDGKSTRYKYVSLPSDLNQEVEVRNALRGSIDSVGIITGGNNYKVNDPVVFNEANTGGGGVSARVSRILGRPVESVSVATSSISGVEFYPSGVKGKFIAFTENPNDFRNSDIISVSGVSTSGSKLEGTYLAGIGTNVYRVAGVGTTSSGIGTVEATGIVTYINVVGNLNYPDIRENDILQIGTETVKVLNVDPRLSRLRVRRSVNGVVGVSHTVGTGVTSLQRKLTITSGFKTDFAYRTNKQVYFNPAETVGLGSTAGVGIGSTIFFTNPGTGATSTIIPTKTLFFKDHEFRTGDLVTYSANGGSGIIVQDETNVGVGTTVADGTQLFIAKVSENLIGLSTVRVGLGTTGTFVGVGTTASTTLAFLGIGTGVEHSLKTNHTVITGTVSRNRVTVSTGQTHELSVNHDIFLDVNPGVASAFTIKYNDFNRKIVVNPKSYSSTGINTSTGVITIVNHEFINGQKVIYTSGDVAEGLTDNDIYYVAVTGKDTFKLANSYEDSVRNIPATVGIASTGGGGTINPINPPLNLYKDSTVTFNLTDSSLSHTVQNTSYPSFEFNLYHDANFSNKYVGKLSDGRNFDVTRTGRPGIDGTAKVSLVVNDDTPDRLYYRLDPVYESDDVPAEKTQISIDADVLENNTAKVLKSLYNGKHRVSTAASDSFTFTLGVTPEKSSYISSTSAANITYETTCTHARGPVTQIEIVNGGRSYFALPGVTTITSVDGRGVILEAKGNKIGRINKTRIKNIGFDFPSDKSLRPSITLPNVISIKSLKSFDAIGISSAGRGYSTAPKLLVFDGRTNERITDVDLKYELGDNQVTILRNTKGMSNTTPVILPTANTNGVGISTIGFNTTTNQVTVTLAVGFSTADSFPCEVGDKVLIENISVGIGSTGKGFNSSAYDYKLFPIIAVDKNLGGIGATVAYSLEGLVDTDRGEFVGKFDSFNSGGRLIPEKHFPLFDVSLKDNEFLQDEIVSSPNTSGIVESWDRKTGTLRVSTNKDFAVGEIITGQASNTQGIASSVTTYNSILDTDASSRVIKGSQTDSGFLNASLQRVQDSFYYQNFSYSLRSRVDFDTWNDAVSVTNHTAGFRKFSDYQLETPASFSEVTGNSMAVGLSTELSYFSVVNDLYGVADLNCVYNFDLVAENSLDAAGAMYSDEVIFASRILTDFFESFGNRAVNFDNISGLFNSNPRATRFSLIDSFNINNSRALKYFIYTKDERYVGHRQFDIVTMVQDGTFAYMNQYGRNDTVGELGSYDMTISGVNGSLQFFPNDFAFNDYQIVNIAYHLDDNVVGLGTTVNLGGGTAEIHTCSVDCSGGTTTVVSAAVTTRSLKMYSVLSDLTNNEYQYDEMNLIHDGSEVYVTEFGRLSTNQGSFVGTGFGTFYPHIDGETLKVDFIPEPGIAVTCNTLRVGLGSENIVGFGTEEMKHAFIDAQTTTIASSGTPGITTVASYLPEYDAAYFMVQISDVANEHYEMREIMVLDDDTQEDGTGTTYIQEFGMVETESTLPYVTGLGTFGARTSSGGVSLTFTPTAGIGVSVKTYMNALRLEDDSKDEIDFGNGLIVSHYARYEGTENAVKKSFNLEHRSAPVFEKYFVGNDSDIVSIDANTIRIPNHFYVTGEAIRYDRNGGITSAIGIATTSFAGVGNTEYLPTGEDIFVIKISDDKIKLASSAENALKRIAVPIELESVGIGTSHRFIATNQNARCLIALDNLIQSPIVSTAQTQTLAKNVTSVDNDVFLSGITSFFGSDLIQLGDEIMKITGVGVGSTNRFLVRRGWLGTRVGTGDTGDTITKVVGNYNILDNVLHFVEAPYGGQPIGSITNRPDERDWTGITTGSSFQGRTFMRSGIPDTTQDTYHTNYLFDSLSDKFDGNTPTYTLTSAGSSDISGISTGNAIILINDILQGPGNSRDFTMGENLGVTTITFTGTASSTTTDANTSNLPLGGVLLSLGSTEGSGYQPLVSAGGTAVVSGLGTISLVSIANSGSGYRVPTKYEFLADIASPVGVGSTEIYLENTGSVLDLVATLNTGSNCTIGIGTDLTPVTIVSTASTFVRIGTSNTISTVMREGTQTKLIITDPQVGFVNVSVGESATGVGTMTHVGFATIMTGTGNISTSVTITNPGSGYTTLINPFVEVDGPLSYTNIPLNYVGTANSGLNATVDIVVGNGSSVTDFSINNKGVGYKPGEILTVPTGGLTGIPTSGTFDQFELTVQTVFSDEFTGWSLGVLQALDDPSALFDGSTKAFNLTLAGNQISIRAPRGSKVDVEQVLIITINDILQEPGQGYQFPGGSVLTFAEAPKVGDTCKILFFKGTGDDTDVILREVIETVKKGDELTLGYDPARGQDKFLQEEERTVTNVNSTDVVQTFPYFGPGNTGDEELFRPVVWCRQTEDKIIDEKRVAKDRELYEPLIYPFAHITKSVGIGSTHVYVDRVRPLFNGQNENDTSLTFQEKVKFVSQVTKVGASATAVVSAAGTISSLVISDGGVGYSTATVSIGGTAQQDPTLGFTTATARVTISAGGTISALTLTNVGTGYTTDKPPVVLISPPTDEEEENLITNYFGDSGVIVGFGTTTVSGVTTQFIFDLHIPYESKLRETTIVGTAVTLSSLGVNDYFIVSNSNVGSATTSITSIDPVDSSTAGVGKSFIDNVYVVQSVQNVERNIIGIGTSVFRRVFVNIDDTFAFGTAGTISTTTLAGYGEYSWGKMVMASRAANNSYSAYTSGGIIGINTGMRVERSQQLKSKNYIVSNT